MATNQPLVYPEPALGLGDVVLSRWGEGPDDAAALAAAWADELVQQGCAVPPADKRRVDDAQRWIVGHQERMDAGLALDLVVRSAAGEVTGEVGLGPFDWNRRAALLGFWTAPTWRGQGRAAQGCRLLCDWAFAELGLVAILAETTESNRGSQRVLEQAGFTQLPPQTRPQPEPQSGNQVWARKPH